MGIDQIYETREKLGIHLCQVKDQPWEDGQAKRGLLAMSVTI